MDIPQFQKTESHTFDIIIGLHKLYGLGSTKLEDVKTKLIALPEQFSFISLVFGTLLGTGRVKLNSPIITHNNVLELLKH